MMGRRDLSQQIGNGAKKSPPFVPPLHGLRGLADRGLMVQRFYTHPYTTLHEAPCSGRITTRAIRSRPTG
jgi:hypothetical protein